MAEVDWPFLGTEALADKAIPERAMRRLYEPVYPGVFAPWGIELDASQRALAAYAVMEVLEWAHAEQMHEAGLVLDAQLAERIFTASFEANLRRLLRSLLKLRGERAAGEVEADFARLRRAYDLAWKRGC